MDRQGDSSPSSALDDVDGATSGWDAYTVWRPRVHQPRRAPASRPLAPGAAFEVDEAAEGWDPTETWQLRVRRARDPR